MRLGLGHYGAGAHWDARVEHPCWRAIMVFALTEAAMLVEGGCGAEHLPTVLALDLCAAVSVHTFVAAQVRELGVGLVAYLTCTDKETDIERISMQHTHTHTQTK